MAEPVSLNLTALQAVVAWTGTDGQTNHLYRRDDDPSFQVALDVKYNRLQGQSDSGLFKLRVPLHLKSSPQEKTSLLLYIRLERIASLLCQQSDDSVSSGTQVDGVDAPVRTKLGPQTVVCLKFVLKSPADMIVPSGVPLIPSKMRPHGRQMYLLTHLAQTTSFSIYLRAQDLGSPSSLQDLADAITDPAREVQSSAEADDISSLYSGQGGRVLDLTELSANATKAVPSLPPSYENVGAPPPMAPLDEKSVAGGPSTSSKPRKRPRDSDLDETSSGSGVETTCRNMVDSMYRRFQQELDILRKHQQDDRAFMMEFVGTEIQKARSEITASITASVQNKVQNTRKELMEYIDRRTQSSDRCTDFDELDYRLTDLERDAENANNRVDVQVDEAIVCYKSEAEAEKEAFKSEMRDFVTEQLDEVQERAVEEIEERVMERLNGASVSVERARLRLE